MRIGSIFSGAAGLDMAVQAVFGGKVVWHSEIDKSASKVLAYRYPDVPNLGDITQINWANWKPMLEVDILCGGFPCQDVSSAGRRAGIKEGTRSGLWSIFADAIDILRPPVVIIENVRGLLSAQAHRNVESVDPVVGDGEHRPVLRAAGAVLGDLADIGYDAQWTTLAAGDIGAPHRRERVFILATDTGYWHDSEWARAAGWEARERPSVRVLAGRDCRAVALSGGAAVGFDTGGTPCQEAGAHSGDGFGDHRGTRPDVKLLPTPNASDCTGGGAHPDSREGHSRQLIDFALMAGTTAWGKYEPAIRRWEHLTRPAPAPTEPNKNGNPRLAAAFSEWLMGWPDGWVTDPAIGISRNDQLRIIGNGVVPQQAAAALQQLLSITEIAA